MGGITKNAPIVTPDILDVSEKSWPIIPPSLPPSYSKSQGVGSKMVHQRVVAGNTNCCVQFYLVK